MANSMNKKKKVKISGILTILLCITAIGIVAALGFNIYKIKTSNTGNGDTVETEKVDNEYSNEKYSIGNNPTDINKKYFKELNEAIKGKDVKDENGNTYTGEEAIAETVVKNFICQYYTWTNKDVTMILAVCNISIHQSSLTLKHIHCITSIKIWIYIYQRMVEVL